MPTITQFEYIIAVNKAKHFAIHRTFLKRNKNGTTQRHEITEENSNEIIKSIQKKGITEGFIVVDDNTKVSISPKDISKTGISHILENTHAQSYIINDSGPTQSDAENE